MSALGRLGITSRAKQFFGASGGGEGKTIEKTTVFISDGFTPPPIVREAQEVAADYYRFGKIGSGENPIFEVQPKALSPREMDEDIASIRLRGKGTEGEEERDLIPPYSKFIMSQVVEAHVERSQIVETFGDFYVFFHGERPPVYSFTGTLINTKNVNWVTDWNFFYDNYLRGTRCVEQRARVVLTYGGRQIEGFMLDTSNSTAAALEAGVGFQFRIVVTSRKYLGFSEDFGFIATSGGLGEQEIVKQEKKLAELVDKIAGKEGAGTSDTGSSNAFGSTKGAMAGGPSQDLTSFGSSTFA